MNNQRFVFQIAFLSIILGLLVSGGSVTGTNTTGQSDTDTKIVLHEGAPQSIINQSNQVDFFYDDDCGACQNVMPFIDNLSATYPKIRINYYNVCGGDRNGKQNQDLLTKYKTDHGLSDAHVPIVFIRDISIQGENNILKDMIPALP